MFTKQIDLFQFQIDLILIGLNLIWKFLIWSECDLKSENCYRINLNLIWSELKSELILNHLFCWKFVIFQSCTYENLINVRIVRIGRKLWLFVENSLIWCLECDSTIFMLIWCALMFILNFNWFYWFSKRKT